MSRLCTGGRCVHSFHKPRLNIIIASHDGITLLTSILTAVEGSGAGHNLPGQHICLPGGHTGGHGGGEQGAEWRRVGG